MSVNGDEWADDVAFNGVRGLVGGADLGVVCMEEGADDLGGVERPRDISVGGALFIFSSGVRGILFLLCSGVEW